VAARIFSSSSKASELKEENDTTRVGAEGSPFTLTQELKESEALSSLLVSATEEESCGITPKICDVPSSPEMTP
jgi:hypothetical protein